jgi:phage terminase large subunit
MLVSTQAGLPAGAAPLQILYGGQAGIKSWSIAQFLLAAGSERPLRIPCARETMQSIRDSVHQLLEDQIKQLGLQAHYQVLKAEIIGATAPAAQGGGKAESNRRLP